MDAVMYGMETAFGATLGVWLALLFIAQTYRTFRRPPGRKIPVKVPPKDGV